jgi:uncharacterized membrane protein YqgA involved in biofilm formation
VVLQGGLTLAARPLSKATQKEGRVEELTACGGLILAAMGLRILQLKQIPVGDILPGLVLAPFIVTVLAKKGWYP